MQRCSVCCAPGQRLPPQGSQSRLQVRAAAWQISSHRRKDSFGLDLGAQQGEGSPIYSLLVTLLELVMVNSTSLVFGIHDIPFWVMSSTSMMISGSARPVIFSNDVSTSAPPTPTATGCLGLLCSCSCYRQRTKPQPVRRAGPLLDPFGLPFRVQPGTAQVEGDGGPGLHLLQPRGFSSEPRLQRERQHVFVFLVSI